MLMIGQVYIAYLGSLPEGEFSPMSQHLSVLDDVLEGSSATDSLVRSYKRSFNGFAAKLTEKEREKLANKEGVVSIFENKILKLQTTRSWDFMGFSETARRKPALESDVIIGVFDTGIWPESQSFSDKDFGPPPRKWKGVCSGGESFTCNKKVIGARIYNSLNDTFDNEVRDIDGHGSHTASIAAGNNVENASFHGLAQGKARGGVPSARLAIYKVCVLIGCASADILAAFDDAIADGVDIISISLGFEAAVALEEDPIAIGAFHAMARSILTVNSGGNRGPEVYSINSVAPWMVSVAASTTDRKIIDRVVLGNGKELTGRSFNYFTMNGSMYPMIYGNDSSLKDACNEFLSKVCVKDCLNSSAVKGKILLCDSTHGDDGAHWAGASGTITWDNSGVASVFPLPTIALNDSDLQIVHSYYKSTNKAEAKILKSEAIKDSSAPVVASFSSRGPNSVIPEIMKPDITAPGVDILAAFSPIPKLVDGISVEYNILSGTSMACPHVAGIAAYVKSFHPAWSASAIRSALMTTARPMKVSANLHGVLSFGSGHVDPVKAISPGLVYETTKDNYTQMLCDMGYNTTMVRLISGDNSSCPKDSKGSPKDLNYPSMTVYVKQLRPFKVEFPRTVTNVGRSNSTYKAQVIIRKHPRMKVEVNPPMLSFKLKKEKKSFVVTVTGQGMTMERPVESATLVWSDGTHTVRSPVIVYTDFLI
ncbi:subtilisin-like protease SBT4.6 [Vitis riparia]|uniref:subtilisin-like protease SBT4.6 n=1 Tax=Vitis riparia TaxID=96939 RepID=UPI00155AADF7|nr:subtilisin-like protease SBT4.6 [Vitis riparia]